MSDEKTMDQQSYDEVGGQIEAFDFDRVALLLGIIEKVTTVTPKNTAFIGLAQAELERLHTEAQAIARERGEHLKRLQAEEAARQQQERLRQEAIEAQQREADEQARRDAATAKEPEVVDTDGDGETLDENPAPRVPRIQSTPNGRRV